MDILLLARFRDRLTLVELFPENIMGFINHNNIRSAFCINLTHLSYLHINILSFLSLFILICLIEILFHVQSSQEKSCERHLIRMEFWVSYIRTIKDIYDAAKTSVRTHDRATEDFPTTIGLHQGLTLNPYLFTLVMDILTQHI